MDVRTAKSRARRLLALLLAAPLTATGCATTVTRAASTAHHAEPAATTAPAGLLAQARPIGRGRRFHPPATGLMAGPCRPHLGPRYGVHIEVFARDRVVLLPAGIGTEPPRRTLDGRIVTARCYGELATVDPTGLVLVRPDRRPRLAALFQAWGEPLSSHELAGFRAPRGTRVRAFVDGRDSELSPGSIRLGRHAEIVLEVGPLVPPHRRYAFPSGT